MSRVPTRLFNQIDDEFAGTRKSSGGKLLFDKRLGRCRKLNEYRHWFSTYEGSERCLLNHMPPNDFRQTTRRALTNAKNQVTISEARIEADGAKKQPRGRVFRGPRGVIPWRRSGCDTAPPRSTKLHREAPTPAQLTQKLRSASLFASTQEGGQRPVPANRPPPVKLLKWLVSRQPSEAIHHAACRRHR